jgi:hypothetical protein
MIKIQPIQIPTIGTAESINIVVGSINLPCEYGVGIQYQLMANGLSALEGNLSMSEEIYSQWGTDDNFVIDWVLNELNLQRL